MMNWPSPDEWKRLFPDIQGRCDLRISAVATIGRPRDNALLFVKRMTPEVLDALLVRGGCLLLLHAGQKEMCRPLEERHAVLYSDDPRYQYAEILDKICDKRRVRGKLTWDPARGLFLGENVRIDPSAHVEPGVTIAGDCDIGPEVHILTGARIGPRVRIGARSVVRENAVVGGYGFGYALAKGKPPIRLPHIGGVVIGEDVEIGALTTACSGTIDPTIIEDRAKIDDHVHIAHNCRIEKEVIITACAEISGSVRVGKRTWLAPNCSIMNKIEIGADCTVGLGAVVEESLPDGTKVMGNAARSLLEIMREKKQMAKLLQEKA